MQALEQFASQIELKLLTLVAENHECWRSWAPDDSERKAKQN
jgi:hypothetical protein